MRRFLLIAISFIVLTRIYAVPHETEVIVPKTFQCSALQKSIHYSIYVPPGPAPQNGWPLVLFLHGLGRNHRTIAEHENCAAKITQSPFVVVFPDGAEGWYLDSQSTSNSRYQSMLKELLDHVRSTYPVSHKAELTGFCGWSMGGYGSVRFAETYPAEVGAVGTIIALLDFPNPSLPKNQNFGVSPLFGTDPEWWNLNNCMNSAEALRGKAILQIAGSTAFDYKMNLNFHHRLQSLGIEHTYVEMEGGHVFSVVENALPRLLSFFQNTFQVNALSSSPKNNPHQ